MESAEWQEKMVAVVDALHANDDVVLDGGYEVNRLHTGQLPNPDGYWSRTLDIYTHPLEPIYDHQELEQYMRGLVPEVIPTTSDSFRQYDTDDRMDLGKLYYDEVIGSMQTDADGTTRVELLEGLSIVNNGFVDQSWTVEGIPGSQQTPREAELRQRTWLRVFPDGGHAADAAIGINKFKIPAGQLGRADEAKVVPSLLHSPTIMNAVMNG